MGRFVLSVALRFCGALLLAGMIAAGCAFAFGKPKASAMSAAMVQHCIKVDHKSQEGLALQKFECESPLGVATSFCVLVVCSEEDGPERLCFAQCDFLYPEKEETEDISI